MKRYIKSAAVYADDYDYSPYQGHKYLISGSDSSGNNDTRYADDPVAAIKAWFSISTKFPQETSIMTPKKSYAFELCKAATSDLLTSLGRKYHNPYRIDYLIDSAARQVENGCRDFYEGPYGYGDQVEPFSNG